LPILAAIYDYFLLHYHIFFDTSILAFTPFQIRFQLHCYADTFTPATPITGLAAFGHADRLLFIISRHFHWLSLNITPFSFTGTFADIRAGQSFLRHISQATPLSSIDITPLQTLMS
jgi:hypothetical protein